MLDMTKESVDTFFDKDKLEIILTNARVTANSHHKNSVW